MNNLMKKLNNKKDNAFLHFKNNKNKLLKPQKFSLRNFCSDQESRRFLTYKKAISIPFEWIFAMIIGAIIIFLAIYVATKGFDTGNKYVNTQVISRLEGFLSPYETGIGSGQTGEIHFTASSVVYFNKCEAQPNSRYPFGRQFMSFTQEMFDRYQKGSEPVELISKYVFANESTEGKDFYITSIPFFMGYKVSDVIIIYTDKYCFIEAPNEIQEMMIENLKMKNIYFSDTMNCSGIKVCFFDSSNNNCDIKVIPESSEDYSSGRIEKYNKKTKRYTSSYYIGNLIYAGIFSSENLYECNVRRLMLKFIELGRVYLEKIRIIEMNSCSSNIGGKLNPLMQAAGDISSSLALLSFTDQINDIIKINDAATEGCRLFSGE